MTRSSEPAADARYASRSFPKRQGKQHYFAALVGLEFKSLGKVFEGKVGQGRAEIEAGFEKTGQTIPGAEEAAAGNAMDTDTFKMTSLARSCR